MDKKRRSFALAASLCAVILPVTASLAQHGEHGQHEHAEAEVVEPNTYANAIEVIHVQLQKIQRLIATGKLDRVHAEAAVIRDVAWTLARLALDQDSGVPRKAIREINLTAKDLAAKFDPIDEAGDSGNLTGTQKVYDEMVALFETLQRYAPREHRAIAAGSYSVDVKPTGGSIEPGVSTALDFTIKDPTGATVKNLEVVHERVLHLLMVSDDLSWYAHEHPVAQSDGSFRLSFKFPRGGEYVLFCDFSPSGAGGQVVPVTLRVQGLSGASIPLVVDVESAKQVDGYTIRLDTSGPIYAGGEAVLSYSISRRGRPVADLEPYLGAIGHLVLISRDLKHFVHSHPLGREHAGRGHHVNDQRGAGGHDEHNEHGGFVTGSTGSVVSFHARFPEAGLYKAWAEFKHRGRILTVPFVIDVEPSEHRDTEHGHRDREQHPH
ncbi:MAG: hypothetical protein IH888_05160 [Planctomycetes bacterium]|nr:hypothetical protein [Planctomycetota bacterium]